MPFYYSTMTYTVVSWKEGRIWSAMSPSVPGVFGLGRTRRAAERDFAKALETLVDYLGEIGERLPRPRAVHISNIRV